MGRRNVLRRRRVERACLWGVGALLCEGAKRRCGWFDPIEDRQAATLGSFFFRDFDMNLRLGGEKFATAQACEIHRSDCIKDGEDDDIERKGKSDVCYCRKEQASNQASKLNGK